MASAFPSPPNTHNQHTHARTHARFTDKHATCVTGTEGWGRNRVGPHLAIVHAVKAGFGAAILDVNARHQIAVVITNAYHEHVGTLPLAVDCQLSKYGAHLQTTAGQ